jgi:eukaryotic-like serine/threonine-protein kinase
VTVSPLKAVEPDLPFQSSSTGSAHYAQQRTALFAKVALVCSVAGLLLRLIADLVKDQFGPARVYGYTCLLVSALMVLGLWLFTRNKPRPQKWIRLVELVALSVGIIAASFAFRLSTPDLLIGAVASGDAQPASLFSTNSEFVRLPFEFSGLLISMLMATQTLTVRAAVVPSSIKYSLLLAAVVGAPVCLFTGLGWPATLPYAPDLTQNTRGFLMSFGFTWWLFTCAACGVISRVVHRLQSEVRVAKRLGQYELEGKIGQGGMGVVYRAKHAMMKRPVAIKLLPAAVAEETAIARFEREVQLTSQLSHPNTVVIHDYGRTHEGVFYYVMELIRGATLDRVVVGSGPMPSGRVVRILEMVAGALGEAHEHGLVHRDIKPANILLGPRGGEPDVAKVLDFGLVRAIRMESRVTNADIAMGTPQFMSPEAMKAPQTVDGRSDLYSLGAVAYYLLTGHNVFDGQSALEICGHHMHTLPRPLRELVPDVDPELERLVLACLAKAPTDRPQTARAVCDALLLCPSRADWNNERARAWWALHDQLLHPIEPAKPVPAGASISKTLKCDWEIAPSDDVDA